jgi:transcriptional regulator with XRE-family HTH domain
MIYDNFVRLCNSVGKAPSAVALELGISKSAVSNWKHQRNEMTAATALKIADYFGITVDELKNGIKKQPSIPKDEELNKNDAVWEKREEISRMLPDLTSQQLSDIINYIENTNNPELNARYSELLKIASMMSSEKYQTVMALLKELL